MRTNQLMAVLAVERCRFRLSHLGAVAHLAGPGGNLQEKTIMALLRALESDLALIEESIGQDIEAAGEA